MIQLTIFTGTIFLSQLLVCEILGIIERKPGFEWLTWGLGAIFFIVLIVTVIDLNIKYRKHREEMNKLLNR